jgi:ABC-type antimicrobial peptide transport system permease subunit
MAYTVARRTREIGVRMALGTVHGDVVWLVMQEVFVLVGSGLILGLDAACGLNRFVSSQLYGVTGNDPITMAGRRPPSQPLRFSPLTCRRDARRASTRSSR